LETDFEGDAEIVFDNFAFHGVDPDTLPRLVPLTRERGRNLRDRAGVPV
jgi:hypothetical protein